MDSARSSDRRREGKPVLLERMRGRGPPDITQMNGSYQSNKYQDTRIGKRENENYNGVEQRPAKLHLIYKILRILHAWDWQTNYIYSLGFYAGVCRRHNLIFSTIFPRFYSVSFTQTNFPSHSSRYLPYYVAS